MTAEIAVMNQSAVALAADSAATRSQAKIFNANKIFALSKYRPVAVMIYGLSACMNVPWETIIKEFRAELGDKNCATIGDYGDELFAFIAANRALFPESEQDHFAYRYAAAKFSRIKQSIREEVNKRIETGGPLTWQQGSDVAQEVINQRAEFWKQQPRRPKLPRDLRRRARERYGDQIAKARDDVLQQLPLTAKQRETLMQITLDSWQNEPNAGETGVVIAGFGRNDMFPSLVAYWIDGVLLNRPISWESHERVSVDHSQGAVIVPFAQDDMFRLFVEGVTPAYEMFIEGYFQQIVTGLSAIVLNELPADAAMEPIKDRLKKHQATVLGSLAEKLKEKRSSLYVNPLLSIVSGLPMDELASLAESLVNLTSLRRRVSLEQESVGGPIDVAVISRGDGLVWIKRKHYFPPELNQQFFANYFRR
jgi:hypothetical protein